LNGIDSKFRLAILVARRAKQLIGGARKKIDFKSDNPLTVAMEEFKQGKIDFDVLNEVESLFGPDSDILEGSVETGGAALEGEEAEGETVEEVEDAEDAEDIEDAEESEEEAEPESES
jgi:DNA-directed RNA polymerase subunit omega